MHTHNKRKKECTHIYKIIEKKKRTYIQNFFFKTHAHTKERNKTRAQKKNVF